MDNIGSLKSPTYSIRKNGATWLHLFINILERFLSSGLYPLPLTCIHPPSAAPGLLGNTVQGLHPRVVTSINPDTNHRKPPQNASSNLFAISMCFSEASITAVTTTCYLFHRAWQKKEGELKIRPEFLIYSHYFYPLKCILYKPSSLDVSAVDGEIRQCC